MKRSFTAFLLAILTAFPLNAEPTIVPVTPIKDGNNPDNPRSPIEIPVLYLDGYTLTAGDYTLGSTIQLLDENDNVVFSTYVSIEGDIALPATLSGTYTILVIRDDAAFVGEITL